MLLVIFALTGKYVYDSRWLYRVTYRHSVTCPHAPPWCRQYRQTPPLGPGPSPAAALGWSRLSLLDAYYLPGTFSGLQIFTNLILTKFLKSICLEKITCPRLVDVLVQDSRLNTFSSTSLSLL